MATPSSFRQQTTVVLSTLAVAGPADLQFTQLVRATPHISQLLNSNDTDVVSPYPAAAVTFLAFLASFSQHIAITLVASILSFLAALITLIAFCVDIALLAFVRHEISDHLDGVNGKTNTGPGKTISISPITIMLMHIICIIQDSGLPSFRSSSSSWLVALSALVGAAPAWRMQAPTLCPRASRSGAASAGTEIGRSPIDMRNACSISDWNFSGKDEDYDFMEYQTRNICQSF